MSGTLQATATQGTGGQLSITPAACPLAANIAGGGLVSCVTHDMWGQEHHCPYLAGLRHVGSVTRPLSMEHIRLRMIERMTRSERCIVSCLEARPTVLPGA